MRKQALVLTVVATLTACQSNNSPVDPLEEAFGAAFDVLTVYAGRGDIGQQGVDFVDALVVYSGTSCQILTNPGLTPEQKAFALEFEVAPYRHEFDRALADIADVGNIDPVMQVLINRARSIARRYAHAETVSPEFWARPCAIAGEFGNGWRLRRPVVTAGS